MKVTAWRNGKFSNPKTVYGIRVGATNRTAHFPAGLEQIVVEMDCEAQTFRLTDGFWRKCPEFRDAGGGAIRGWLEQHHTTDWARGSPPQFELHPLRAPGHFRLE